MGLREIQDMYAGFGLSILDRLANIKAKSAVELL